ncbi:hypothetical protein DPEC_G00331360 [Dallia pectoralis]|uniref:Uncharacterized protein n=1 Tax=Dallia pectoralis TaxID=75939 RepID=A0ACC2F943_DALPE|nr:hypothetical protein DPEC_G00331360 [Dallia pectoralis]
MVRDNNLIRLREIRDKVIADNVNFESIDDVRLTTIDRVLRCQKIYIDFYSNLYTAKTTDDNLIDRLLKHIAPIPEEEEGDLLPEELTRAMQTLSTVGSDQTCGAPGRSAWDNLSAVRDIFAHSAERSQPFCLFNLDQEKAFDRVSHPYMLKVMARMNLAYGLRNWVSIMYQNITSSVLINGTPSEPIPIHSAIPKKRNCKHPGPVPDAAAGKTPSPRLKRK